MRYLAFGMVLSALLVTGCSNTSTNPPASLYSLSYHAGPPLNRDYSKTLVETDVRKYYDAAAHDSVSYLYIRAFGTCSCGSVTDQFFMTCDSMGNPVTVPTDSGSMCMKINGDLHEAYQHGTLRVVSFTRTADKITAQFGGAIYYGMDTVAITAGQVVAPSAQ